MTSNPSQKAIRSATDWPVNAWYVAAASDEVGTSVLGRRICGLPVAMFRAADGVVAAMEDFCPHRGAPLSLGFVRDGQLVCGYHGLAAECTGRVASMPGQRVGGFPRIRSFAVVERFGFIWLWPGDPDFADPGKLPQLEWADSPDWAYGGSRFHVLCDYRLMIDNLMDLTHETYVHGSSIGQKEIDEAPVKTRKIGQNIITSRFMDRVKAPPFWRMALSGVGLPQDEAVDRWQICRFSLPSSVMIEVGVALAGRGGYDAPDNVKVSSIVVDFMTPETEKSHHYFWGMARKFAVDDPLLTDKIRDGQFQIFREDLEVLERQQANLDSDQGRRLLLLNIDAGGARSREMIEAAITKETLGNPTPGNEHPLGSDRDRMSR